MCVMLKTFASLFCRTKVKLISIRVSPTMPLMCKAVLMWTCHLEKKFTMKKKMLCVHSLLCHLWGWNLTVLMKRGEFTMLMHSKWVSVSGLHHQGTVLLLRSLLGRNLSAHMPEGQIVSRRTTLQLARRPMMYQKLRPQRGRARPKM